MDTKFSTIYLDGGFVEALSQQHSEVLNPATEHVVGVAPACGAADVDRAVAAARKALTRQDWAGTSGADRARLLERFADELTARADDMATVITSEAGFPAMLTGQVHVQQAIEFVRYFAALVATEQLSESRQTHNSPATVEIRQCPVGVVATLTPWNIPLLGALSKIAPALAAGCTVVHKPAPQTPLSSYLLADAAHAAGFPAGVFNMVPADLAGSRRLVAHPDVDMVAFTGSTAVGREVAESCAKDFRRCALELGGNAAAIILEDASVELISAGLGLTGLALNNGEACIAQRRVLVPRNRHDEIVAVLAGVAQSLKVGDPAQPDTVIGPMITRQHRDRVLDYVSEAAAAGAVVAAGGGIPADLDTGYFVEPTVLANVSNEMRAAREEIFGPVLCVIAYDTIEEAIEIAQDTEYGLSSSVWTADFARGQEVARQLRAGSVYINASLALDPAIPFGGFGSSGIGRELGPEGLNEYRETQAIFTPLG
ncbi:aldehyde dehydrogenase family protein [Hoyosella subflava]|uniref:aldehyde dehydrogenase (NAD(+)) n=1 Tax=Hoyosella subflava (strain DSM 45089 / JCM 17490 / NBRC 109087 / DQS3-9A1) TaxID=443218 RepID=F6EM37_HOYSD|nr:aldehyde dehydrogenase family protein [Hoyosella subflava]AEF39243.1 Betaine-aldehyde dehydrogenase [Hoyosella subflava DQS3-9A1]